MKNKKPPVALQAALSHKTKAERHTFSRTWIASRTVLHLATGPLALLNVEYLVFNSDRATSDLLLALPVLLHLGASTKTLLKKPRDLFDGTDCLAILKSDGKSTGYHVS